MASVPRANPRWNSYRPSYGRDKSPDTPMAETSRPVPIKRHSEYRREPPNESRRDRDYGENGSNNRPNSRRSSLGSTYNSNDGDKLQVPRVNSSHDLSQDGILPALDSAPGNHHPSPQKPPPSRNPSISSNMGTSLKIPAKRSITAEVITDPRKRQGIRGNHGPTYTSTASHLLGSPDELSSILDPPTESSKLQTDSPIQGASGGDSLEKTSYNLANLSEYKQLETVIVEVFEKSVATELLRRKADELQGLADKAALVDKENRITFKDHHALIEQGQATKRKAQENAAAVRARFDSSLESRSQAVLKATTQILSEVEKTSEHNLDRDKQIRDIVQSVEKLSRQTGSFPRDVIKAQETALAAEISARNLAQRVKEAENELRELAKIHQNSDSSSQKLASIDKRVASFEQRRKSETSEGASQINKWINTFEQRQRQERAEELSQINKRLAGLDQHQKQDKSEDLSQINKRLHGLEKWHAQEIAASLRPQDQGSVSAAAFQKLQDMMESLNQKFEAQQQELESLRQTKTAVEAEIASSIVTKVQRAVQESSLGVGTAENAVQTDFLEKTAQDFAQVRSSIKAVDDTRFYEFNSLVADNKNLRLDIDQLRSQLEDNKLDSDARDEVVVQQHNELASRLTKVEGATTKIVEATNTVWAKQEGHANTLWAKHESYVTETKNAVKDLREKLEREMVRMTSQLDSAHGGAHQPAQVNAQLIADLGTLKDWVGGLETDLRVMQEIGFANGHSIKSLDSRFSNLTTEHMVRAMVQQLTIMYPYAATAQAEFTRVREDREMLQEVRKEGASTSLQVTKNTTSIASQKRRVEALERAGLETKLDSIVEQFKEGRDLLQSGLDEQSEKLWKKLEDQKRLHDESMSQVAKIMDSSKISLVTIDELQRRVSKIEASSSSLRDQRTTLANSNGLTSHSKRPVNDASIESSTPPTPTTQADGAGDPEDYLRGWTDPKVASGLKVQQSFHRGSESSETTSTKSNGQKRKRRRWDLENNDRSDDETYVESRPFNSQSSRRTKASRKG